jgi:hypothetical protein
MRCCLPGVILLPEQKKAGLDARLDKLLLLAGEVKNGSFLLPW